MKMKLQNVEFTYDSSVRLYVCPNNDKWMHKVEKKEDKTNWNVLFSHEVKLIARGDGKNSTPFAAFFSVNECGLFDVVKFFVGSKACIQTESAKLDFHYISIDKETIIDESLSSIDTYGSLRSDIISYAAKDENITLISSDGDKYTINKFVFESRSKVFQAMFSSNSDDNRKMNVKFKDINSAVLKDLISFLKNDTVNDISINCIQLGFIAYKYELYQLFKLVEEYLKDNITKDNFEQVVDLAHKFKSIKLFASLGKIDFTI